MRRLMVALLALAALSPAAARAEQNYGSANHMLPLPGQIQRGNGRTPFRIAAAGASLGSGPGPCRLGRWSRR
jgi:hypothetical protein